MGGIVKIIDKIYNSKVGKKLANPTATAATAAAIVTVSNVSKDTVNCAYYTLQSLNNKKIPEDQRPFVAALDLSNGIMNVAMQLLTAFGLSKFVLSICDNHILKSKQFSPDENTIKAKYESLSNELKKNVNFEEFRKQFNQSMKNKRNLAKTGFTVLVVNMAMQIILKRIITPLVATPMASGFKKKFEKHEIKDDDKKQDAKKDLAVA